jgi:hypothetical protein
VHQGRIESQFRGMSRRDGQLPQDSSPPPGVDSSCRAISTRPCPVRAVITNSSPATRHQTLLPWCLSGVEYRTAPEPDGLVGVDQALLIQRDRVRLGGKHVQVGQLGR